MGGAHYIGKALVANDEQIDIAARGFGSAGNRAKDQGERRSQRGQCIGKHLRGTGGFAQQACQLRERGALLVGLVTHLVALLFAQQQPGCGQARQFFVQGAWSRMGLARQLTDVVIRVWVQQQQTEYLLAVGSKQEIGQHM